MHELRVVWRWLLRRRWLIRFAVMRSLCVRLPIIACAPARSVSLFAVIHLVGVDLLEELHDGGVTVERGLNESRGAILHMRKERQRGKEDGRWIE